MPQTPRERPELISGDDFRRLREASGLTQRALARVLGVTPQFICRIERGKTPATKQTELALRHLVDRKLLATSAWLLTEARRGGFLRDDTQAGSVYSAVAAQLRACRAELSEDAAQAAAG